jgi:hypothetical protein
VLPSLGIGFLSGREAEGRAGAAVGEKEVNKLLQPADKSLEKLAMEAAEFQVSTPTAQAPHAGTNAGGRRLCLHADAMFAVLGASSRALPSCGSLAGADWLWGACCLCVVWHPSLTRAPHLRLQLAFSCVRDGCLGLFLPSLLSSQLMPRFLRVGRVQVAVDVFVTAQGYVDVASLSVLPRLTGGSLYSYQPFNAAVDSAKLFNDLRWNLTRPQGLEAVMRVRCSQVRTAAPGGARGKRIGR